MPTQRYRTKDGKVVPSVTTITSRFKDSGGLIYWANRLALEPLMEIRAMCLDGADKEILERFFASRDPDLWDHKLASQKAADAGTIAHEMVDCWASNVEFDTEKYSLDLIKMAWPAFEAFKRWADQSKLEITEREKPLVSEVYRFGGTRDAMLVDGKRAMGDWKTSNGIYPEYLVQLAAYGILDEEAGNEITGGYHLVRFSKQQKPDDPVQFSHYFWTHLDGPRKAFLLMRELYGLMAEVERLAK